MRVPVCLTILCMLPLVCCHPPVHEHGCNLECDDAGHAHWGYDEEDGPDCWGSCYSLCEIGHEQSPINIDECDLHPVDFAPLELDGYREPRDMILYNDGHSAKLKLEADSYFVSGMGLGGLYVADSFHFHWGDTNREGSEHQIGGQAAPLEMHIVHYSEQYDNLGEALGKDGGVAVLGFEFHLANRDNAVLSDVVNGLPSIHYKGSEKILENQRLSRYLPVWYSGKYYRYRGSLTTPDCTEGIIWTLFADTLPVSDAQLQVFRTVLYSGTSQSAHGHTVSHNYRPPQPLNGRKVLVGSLYEDDYFHYHSY